MTVDYRFECDPIKAVANRRKHGVDFNEAATVFLDPGALSVYDEEHSVREERWMTLGFSSSGGLLVVHHTYRMVSETEVRIRIFSARKALRREVLQYRERNP